MYSTPDKLMNSTRLSILFESYPIYIIIISWIFNFIQGGVPQAMEKGPWKRTQSTTEACLWVLPGPRTPLRLHSNSKSSNVTTTSSVPPTSTSHLPSVPPSMESPYTYPPNQVDPTYIQPCWSNHVHFSFEDTGYMIMSGVQSATELKGKRLSEAE